MSRYPGSEEDAVKAEQKWNVVTDESTDVFPDVSERPPPGETALVRPIRYVEAQAGTGSRCVVVATPLSQWGRWSSGGEVMVAVQHPWPAVYPLTYDGTLHSGYVEEKFIRQATRTPHMGDVVLVTKTIAYALGREAVIDL